ncbi:MAG TPA: hypothetical protein PLG15_07385 [Candidatus Gastranaerophilaceae bacterium]|nr:hypothetical protein [Candidatus Gastranaerophilaceae bacterium]HPT42191.1 hypothetical protein [Candidatus Gastranaerophilaceae bacterium]
MILSEFAKYLQEREDEIIEKQSCTKLLGFWLKEILERKPKTNVEKIIHAEISLAKNKAGDFLLVAKSPSGQKLTNALYNFALSFEHHVMKKWLKDKKPDDFK